MTFQKIKPIYIQRKDLFLQNLLMDEETRCFPMMEDEFCFKLKKKKNGIFFFLADFC